MYTELLEKKFTQLVGTPKWASLDAKIKDEDADSDDEILKVKYICQCHRVIVLFHPQNFSRISGYTVLFI